MNHTRYRLSSLDFLSPIFGHLSVFIYYNLKLLSLFILNFPKISHNLKTESKLYYQKNMINLKNIVIKLHCKSINNRYLTDTQHVRIPKLNFNLKIELRLGLYWRIGKGRPTEHPWLSYLYEIKFSAWTTTLRCGLWPSAKLRLKNDACNYMQPILKCCQFAHAFERWDFCFFPARIATVT